MRTITKEQAQRSLLRRQGLLGPRTKAPTLQWVEQLGYVQLDTINRFTRAHDHILFSRIDGCQEGDLLSLVAQRQCFEHWTHDASVIPTRWWPQWQWRCQSIRERGVSPNAWWAKRIGEDAEATVAHVLAEIRERGPLMSRDFEAKGGAHGTWWRWKPTKSALEYLWRAGIITVVERRGFQKVYDLTERVHPMVEPGPRSALIAWACTEALTRIGAATPSEIRAFYWLLNAKEVRDWCKAHAEPVTIEGVGPAWVLPGETFDEDPGDQLRVLSPFDPVARDRKRLTRWWDFHYRFEAFVPEAKRQFGYYVLPILHGDRFVGRIELKANRKAGTVACLGLWWEPGEGHQHDALVQEIAHLCNGLGLQPPHNSLCPTSADGGMGTS